MLPKLSVNFRAYSVVPGLASAPVGAPVSKCSDSYLFSATAQGNDSTVTVRSPRVLSAQKLYPAQSLQTELFKLLRERVVIPENYFSDLIASLEAKNDIFVPAYRQGMARIAKRAISGLIDRHEAFFAIVKCIYHDRFAQMQAIPGLSISRLDPATTGDYFYDSYRKLLTRYGHFSGADDLPLYCVSISKEQDDLTRASAKTFYQDNFYNNYKYFYSNLDVDFLKRSLHRGSCYVLAPELLWYTILRATHSAVKLEISSRMPSLTDYLRRDWSCTRPGILSGCNQELHHHAASGLYSEQTTPLAALEHDLSHLMMWGFHDYPELVLALFHRIALAVQQGFQHHQSFDQINRFIIYDNLLDTELPIEGLPVNVPQLIISALADILKKLMSRMQAEVDVSKQSALRSEISHFIGCVTDFLAHEDLSDAQRLLERYNVERKQSKEMEAFWGRCIEGDFLREQLNRHWTQTCAAALRELS